MNASNKKIKIEYCSLVDNCRRWEFSKIEYRGEFIYIYRCATINHYKNDFK